MRRAIGLVVITIGCIVAVPGMFVGALLMAIGERIGGDL